MPRIDIRDGEAMQRGLGRDSGLRKAPCRYRIRAIGGRYVESRERRADDVAAARDARLNLRD